MFPVIRFYLTFAPLNLNYIVFGDGYETATGRYFESLVTTCKGNGLCFEAGIGKGATIAWLMKNVFPFSVNVSWQNP